MVDHNDDDNNVFFSIQDKPNTENLIIEEDDVISEMTMNCDTPSILNISTDGYLYNHLCGAPLENEYNGGVCDEFFDLSYYKKKELYGEDDYSYYENEYTVKDLMKICEYYKISKNIKTSKCKKPDIISTIILFESLAENQNVVYKRHQMWAYIEALSKDSIMRKYILWN
jgi:hypothetical protein